MQLITNRKDLFTALALDAHRGCDIYVNIHNESGDIAMLTAFGSMTLEMQCRRFSDRQMLIAYVLEDITGIMNTRHETMIIQDHTFFREVGSLVTYMVDQYKFWHNDKVFFPSPASLREEYKDYLIRHSELSEDYPYTLMGYVKTRYEEQKLGASYDRWDAEYIMPLLSTGAYIPDHLEATEKAFLSKFRNYDFIFCR